MVVWGGVKVGVEGEDVVGCWEVEGLGLGGLVWLFGVELEVDGGWVGVFGWFGLVGSGVGGWYASGIPMHTYEPDPPIPLKGSP